MRAKIGIFALITGGLLLVATTALAQDRTTGAVKGMIADQTTDEPVAGATVVFSGPALQGTQAQITGASGEYFVGNLPPGTYLMTVYFGEAQFSRTNVLIQLGKVSQVNFDINTQASKGEVIQVEGRAPIIDQGSTKTGRTITQDFTQNVPTGRTFGEVLGAAAGTQGDTYGVSFGGSTSAENVYIIEGINTTDPAYGLQSTNLPNEFVQETELITGGYNAEYGRSTGGVVNVLTRTGGNEFRGSVFSYFTPGGLVATEAPMPRAGSSIDRENELAYRAELGAEVGGPIIKDKLWFHVGFSPSFRKFNVHRIIKTQVDRDGDQAPDVDANGFTVLEEVDRNTLDLNGRTMYFTAKLNGAVSANHQGSVAFFGNPDTSNQWATVTGVKNAGAYDNELGAYDVAGKWTSKFFDNKTQIDTVVGFHRNFDRQLPQHDDQIGVRYDVTQPLSDLAMYEVRDHGGVPAACIDDGADDLYPGMMNCPVAFYNVGGMLYREKQTTDRASAMMSGIQRFKAAGYHTIKGGFDVELQQFDRLTDFPGGERYSYRGARRGWRGDRWYGPADGGMGGDGDCDGDGMVGDCNHQLDGVASLTNTRNLGAYLQDSWAVLPNLTVNAGVRWEKQSVLVSETLAKQLDSDVAFEVSNMIAPRLGVIYDPTQEGRSKVFGHWGRFYESIPMDINARAFGGEIYNVNLYGQCSTDPDTSEFEINPQDQCSLDDATRLYFGGGAGELVAPGLKGQFLDELVIGGEYEVANDLKLGASYIRRGLGRVIEDMSTDGGNNYLIANPGESDPAAIDAYIEEEVAAGRLAMEDVDARRELFLAAAEFDEPTRLYNALQVTAEKRFSRDIMMLASYTYSKLQGNFPGLFSPETGQLDPNLTSMYDLPELMANRTGPLAADRNHIFKLDGFYALDLQQIGKFTFGASVRAASGIPHNYLGAHEAYGRGETYILPRGAYDRSPLTTRFDVKVSYGRQLAKTTRIEAFMDVFNLFNQQPGADVDEDYTYEVVNPIVGGTTEDLAHLKVLGSNELIAERATGAPEAATNPNFGNVNARQAPLSIRFGMRLTF